MGCNESSRAVLIDVVWLLIGNEDELSEGRSGVCDFCRLVGDTRVC